MINIHYNPTTGEIVAWDNARLPFAIPGCAITQLTEQLHTIDMAQHKIEDGKIVQKTDAEVFFYHIPAEFEVRAARYAELVNTDWTDTSKGLLDFATYIVRGPNAEGVEEDQIVEVPPQKQRVSWLEYRQKLRDLGTLTNPVDMINQWPLRPDGSDAIEMFRNRV